MNIIPIQFVYNIKDNVDLDTALIELVEEADNYGWYIELILRVKDKQYIINSKIMMLPEINWDFQKAVEYLKNTKGE